ncbi:GNAT family N-acetyltransferase [Paenibacillus puerhi]|uniref:GNAT family N-acetyltransferase n=1 Tax=Paenibacillus puerhi TaxID=2692622 RepID=UPI0013572197|nr:GNAT family N-acetyltransferase [Paenibacillus puerhi]
MEQRTDYRIIRADLERSAEIKGFVLAMMSALYPIGSYDANPQDLTFFEEVYIRPANACFFLAEDGKGRMLGTAAVRPYDRRFPEVEPFIGNGPVCEIVKFYIHPASRRQGVGGRLYAEAERFAREAGFTESYLHTSLYLPGGYPFWQSRGYGERYWESEQLVHMSKSWDNESMEK